MCISACFPNHLIDSERAEGNDVFHHPCRALGGFNNGARSYMQWNLVLGQDKKSLFDWTQNSLVNIDRTTGQIIRNDEYYLMKHLSHFVQGGIHLLKTVEDKNMLAFVTKEGQKVIVVYNPSDAESQKVINIDGKTMSLTLKAKSINTIVL